MYRITHVAMGFAAGLLVGGNSIYSIVCGFMGALGGYIPDLDLRFMHRKFLHNIILPTTLFIVVSILDVMYIDTPYYRDLAFNLIFSLFLGWLLHIFTDSLTTRGVYVLWPLKKDFRFVIFGKIRSNSIIGNLFMFIATSIMFYFWFKEISFDKVVEKIMDYLFLHSFPT